MKNNILKIIILLTVIALLVTGGIFAYTKYYPNITLPENNFDATGTVPNTNISFKYPSDGFYGMGVKFLSNNFNPHIDTTKIKQIGFGHYSISINPAKISEYIDFSISFVTEKGNVDGDYTLENAVKSIKKSHGLTEIDSGRYEMLNGHEFYILKEDDNGLSDMKIWIAYFLQDDGVYEITIQYLKPNNSFDGKDSDTAENRAAYKNNDKLFLEILKNIELK